MTIEKPETPAEKAELDRLLTVSKLVASEDLKQALLSDFDQQRPEAKKTSHRVQTLRDFFNLGRLVPTGLLAGLGAVGFVAGFATVSSSETEAFDQYALYDADVAVEAILSDDEGSALWVAD